MNPVHYCAPAKPRPAEQPVREVACRAVEQLAERVVIVSRGRLARTGQLAELTAGHGGLEQVFLSLTAPGDAPGLGGGR